MAWKVCAGLDEVGDGSGEILPKGLETKAQTNIPIDTLGPSLSVGLDFQAMGEGGEEEPFPDLEAICIHMVLQE